MATKRLDYELVECDVETDEMLINMGPQHPSTHGVLRLALRTDGEVVREVIPHIGYLHRCAEKIGENMTPRQWIPYTDRMDYLSGMSMNLGWALVVEKLLKLEAAGEGPAPAGDDVRVEPHRQPPGGHGLLRARSGEFHALHVCLPRAGEDPRPVRGSLRCAAHAQLYYRRRRNGRPALGLA